MCACFAKWAKSSSDVLQIKPINKILTIEASGIGIAVEKGLQPGGAKIREMGYPLESLAIVESMDDATGTVVFRPQP